MATEVKIPVRLEVLQDSISQIRAILSNLSPNSSSWKELSNILRQMNKEADGLSGAFKKSFGSQNQFKAAEKGIGKIEETLNRMSMVVGRINFSDLELTPEQSATLKQFENEIDQLENKAKNFKNVMKQELQQGDAWQDILLIDKNAVTHSYDEIVKEIQKKVRNIENEQKKAQDAFNIASNATQKADRTLSFFESKGDLKQAFGDSWSQFFTETVNGATRIQGGQHGPLFDWLKNNLEIKPSELKQIGEMNVTNLRRWISEYDVSNIAIQSQKNKATEATAKEKLTAVNAEYTALESASKAIAVTQEKVATSNTDIQKSVQNVREEKEAWKRSVEQTARSLMTQTGALSNLSAACEQLRSTLMHSNEEWLKMSRITNAMSGIRNAVVNFMGFNQVLNITRNATRQALNHIQELDTVMSKIAIVTDMSTKDLWNQVDAYSSMASAYGVSIKGAYEVSQIYYQQGLETADVLTLTNETLKLAKVSGLDYATTTDYMTTALRGFKMEMQDAGTVVDVYSALAANTAVSQEELAVAMSKTASSMQSVGSAFEETSAMIGTMVAVTRESATNIGSAMKSIASRYGELTKNPLSLIDEEGEVMAFNKVDTALQSVGISMKTVDGQFRSFTEVILELSDKWDTLDSTQQRYIATQFAGNRQQSRFLALVSNSDILRENLEVAQNAEDTGDLQALKALDSIESKMEQVKVAYQQFYTTMGVESIWKLGLDGLKEYIEALNNLPKIFGKLPVGAIGAISNIITLIHGIGDKIVSSIAKVWERAIQGEQIRKVAQNISQDIQTSAPEVENSAKQLGQVIKEGILEGMSNVGDEVAKALAQVSNNAVENGLAATKVAKSVTTGTQKPVKLNDVVGPNFNSDLVQKAGGINADNLGDLDAVASRFREEAARLVAAAKGEVQAAFENAGQIDIAAFFTNLFKQNGILDVPAGNLGFKISEGFQQSILQADFEAAALALRIKFQEVIDNAQGNLNNEQLKESFKQIISESNFSELISRAQQAGINVELGLASGLKQNGVAISAASESGKAVIAAINGALGVASPSILAMMAGRYLIEGLAIGIQDELLRATSISEQAGQAIMDKLRAGLEVSGDEFESLRTSLLEELKSANISEELRTEIIQGIESANILSLKYYQHSGLMAVHGMKNSDVEEMAQGFKSFPGTSIAVRTTEQQPWLSYGANQFYFSGKDIDPKTGQSILYLGDGMTPTLGDTKFSSPKDALDYLNSSPEYSAAGLSLEESRLQDILTDLVHQSNFRSAEKRLRQQVATGNSLGVQYKDTKSVEEEFKDFWGESLELTSYPINQIFDNPQKAVLNTVVAHSFEEMLKASAGGMLDSFDLGQVIKEQLFNEISKQRPGLDTDFLSEQLNSELGNSLVSNIASLIDKAFQNSGSSDFMAEAKSREILDYSKVQAAILSSDLNKDAVEQMFANGLDPKKTYFYNPNAEPGAQDHIDTIYKRVQKETNAVFDEQHPEGLNASTSNNESNQSGKNVASGYAHGMEEGNGQAYNAGKALGESGIAGLKAGAGTHSDSVPATESGNDVVNGDVHALEAGKEKAYQAGYELGQAGTQGQIDGKKDAEEFNKGSKKLEDLTLDDIEAEVDNEYFANQGKEIKETLEDSISPIEPKIEISDDEALAAWEELGELRDKASKKGKLNKADTSRKEELFSLLGISQDDFKKSNIQAKITELRGQLQSKTAEAEQTEKVDSIKETTQALQEQAAAQEQVSQAAVAASEVAISTEQQEKAIVEETTQAIQEQNTAQEQTKTATTNAPTPDEIIEAETIESNKTWTTAYEDYLDSLDEESELEAAMGQVSGGFGADAFEEIGQSAEQATESIEKVSEALQSTQVAADIELNFKGIEEADGEAQRLAASLREAGNVGIEAGGRIANSISTAVQEIKSNGLKDWLKTDNGRGFNNTIRQAGSALSLVGQFVSRQEGMEQVGGGITMAAGGMQAISGFFSGNYVQAVQGIINTINGISQFIVTDKEKLEQLSKKAENASNESKKARSEERALDNSLKKVNELEKKRYESAEAEEAYLAAAEELANQFPQFISGFDEMGNVIIDTSNQEQILAQAREKTASATMAAVQAEIEKQKQQQVVNQSEIETALRSMRASTLSHTVVSEDNIEQHRVDYDAIIRNFGVDPTKMNDWVEVLYDQATEPVQKLLEETGAIYKQNTWFGGQQIWGDETALYKAVSEGKFNGTSEETLLRQIFGLDNNTEDSSYQHILNELAVFEDDFDFTQDGALERLNAFIKEVTSFNTLHPKKLPPDWFGEEGAFTKIVNFASEIADTTELLNSLQQQYISGWLSSSLKTGKSLDFVNKNSGLTNILTNYFNALDEDNDWDKYYSSNKKDVDQTIQAFDDFYKKLSLDDEQLKKFEKMSSDTSRYSIDDIVAEFGIGGEEDPIYLALATRYSDISKFVQEQLSKTIEKEFDEKNFSLDSYTITDGSDFETRFKNAAKDAKTSADQKILMAIMDSYKDLDKSGFATQAEAFGTGAFDFIDALKSVPSEIRATIIDTILDNGLLTKEGIQKSIDSINNISGLDGELKTSLTSSLTNAKNNIINNLNLAVSASLDELVENWSDVSKELVSAINDGISLKEAQELVNKARTLGLEDFSLDDFTQSGDKLILSAVKFYQYYNKLTETNENNAIEWEKEYQKAVTLRQTATKNINIDENRTLLKEIGFTLDQSNKTYYDENGLTDSGFEALTKALDTYIKNYEDYNNAALVTAEELNSKLRDSIDLDSLYNASTVEERTKAVNELGNTIDAYLSLGNKVSGLGLNAYQAAEQAARKAADEAGLNEHELSDKLHMVFDKFSSLTSEQIINILYAGGEDAINVLKQLKPEANADEISKVYNAAINRLNTALSDAENIMVGSLVDTGSKLYQILSQINPSGINANGVVQSVYDMVEVYTAIYAEMTRTAGATIAGLNDVYAQLLTAQDQTNIDITEALKNGNGMSYADFGNLLAKYDIKFEDYMTQHYDAVMRDGFGNIRITDWNAFAKSIWGDNLDQVKNTQEYISAFKAYNDGLIELNKNTEQVIVDEIKQIENAKAGDWLNLSEFWTYFNAIKDTLWKDFLDQEAFDRTYSLEESNKLIAEAKEKANAAVFDLNSSLSQWGASFEDGILKIGDNTNLLGIAQTLEQAAQWAGLELGNGLEEVKDAVLNILKSYAEAITKGIQGGLTGAEVQDLITKARDFGITDLEFVQTAEGFQLAETSAIRLYQALKSIDALHAEEVFNALSESLEKTNENFKTTEALMAHITKIRNGTYAADDKISNARKEQYEAELAIAEEILAVRSTTEDDSFNFMDQKIPAGQNNPLNYWAGWQKAFDAINESKKTGRMDYTNFYNLMTEMGNLSALLGGKGIQIGKDLEVNSKNYVDLITAAGKNLTTTSKDTNLKVDLPAIDVNFNSATNMIDDINQGIQKVADEQINMLDGLIAVLETVVAMEKLADITAGGEDDTVIDLGDIFPEIEWNPDGTAKNLDAITEYDKEYQQFLNWIETQRGKNKDLDKALKSLKVNGMSLSDIFGLSAHDLAEKGKEFNEAYVAFLEGMRKAALSGDYDVDNIMASVKQVLAESGITDLTIDTGKSTMIIKGGVITTIDWEDPDVNEVIKQITHKEKASEEEILAAQQQIKDAMEAYLAGKGTGDLELEQVLKINHRIKIDPDTGKKYVMVGTEQFNENDPNWEGALAAQQLLDLGIDSGDITVESDQAIVSNYIIGNKSNIKIVSKDGKMEFSYNDPELGKVTGSNEQEWLDNWVQRYRQVYEDQEGKPLDWTDNEILWRTLNIHVNTKSQVVDDKGKNQDLTHDAETRKYLAEAKKKIPEQFKQSDINNDGDIEIELENGLIWKISGKDIDLQPDGSYDSRKLEALFSETMGIDEALKDTITAAITEALTSLDSLDSSNLTSLGEALQTIANALREIAGIEIDPSKIDLSNLNLGDGEEGEKTPLQIAVEAIVNSFTLGEDDPNKLVEALTAVVNWFTLGEDDPDNLVSALTAIIAAFTPGEDDPNDLVNALNAVIATFSPGEDDPDNLVSALTAIVSLFTPGEDDPNDLVNNLTAIVDYFTKEDDPNNLVKALTAMVSSFTPGEDDPNNLVNGLIAVIGAYLPGDMDPDELVSALTAVVDLFTPGEDDPEELVNGLTAVVDYFTGGTEDPNDLVSALTAVVDLFTSGEDDPDNLVSALSAIVSTFSPGEDVDANELVNGLLATILSYDPGEDDPDDLVNNLTAQIKEYKESSTVKKPQLEDLTQNVSNIETTGADTEIADWRKNVEATPVTVKLKTKFERKNNPNPKNNLNPKEILTNASDENWLPKNDLLHQDAAERTTTFLKNVIQGYKDDKQWSIDGLLPDTEELRNELAEQLEQIFNLDEGTIDWNNSDSIDTLLDSIKNSLADFDITLEGDNMATGFAKGMTDNVSKPMAAAKDMGDSSVDELKNAIRSASPSKETEEIGQYFDEGFEQGITENAQSVIEAATTLGAQTVEGLKEGLEGMDEQLSELETSLKSHFDTMQQQAVAAVDAIQAKLKSLEKHESLTWSIIVDAGDKDQENLLKGLIGNYAGFGAGTQNVAAPTGEMGVAPIRIPVEIVLEEVKQQLEQLLQSLNELRTTPNNIYIQSNLEQVLDWAGKLLALLEKLRNVNPKTNATPKEGENGTGGTNGVETPEMPETSEETTVTAKLVPETSALKGLTTDVDAIVTVDSNSLTAPEGLVVDYIANITGDKPTNLDGLSATWNGNITGDIPDNLPNLTAHYEVTSSGLPPGHIEGTAHYTVTQDGAATGNVGGPARAGGTLMGELGPELVVSKGRYFIAGQNGAEMVNLDKDAIVFNHLQTEQLLKNGMSSGRGRAVTNERNAVAFATGNINGGPAMASAQAALNALKQLRAMWESLRSASVSDLAGAGGGGGGGGGGGNDKVMSPKEWVETVERWYNLTQEIAKLEKQITHEEALRSKLQSDFQKNGHAYYTSQKESLNALRQQIAAQEELNLSRREYYDKRREALKDSPLGQIYTFDAEGQMKFRDDLDPSRFGGFTNAMEWYTDLVGFTEEGKARYTNKEKYERMIEAGFGEYMGYDDEGNKIKRSDYDSEDEYYYALTKQAYDRIDEYQQATQSLWDEIQQGEIDILKLQEDANKLLEEMRDNQMEVENEVLKAIEDMKQREIEALQDERDALEESVGEFIDGLTEALNKERDMYEDQEAQAELNRNRRRLAILQRSGASASDIASLQSEINDQERDLYFDAQQRQIDAIQEASDKEIERLDNQIDLMTKQLEFQKEFGLLWGDVYQVMDQSAQQIADFIMNGNSEFWANSPLQSATLFEETLFKTQQWEDYREDADAIGMYANMMINQMMAGDYEKYDKAMEAEFGKGYDPNGDYKKAFEEEYRRSGDITKASEAGRSLYREDARKAKIAARKAEAGDRWIGTGQYEYEWIDETYHWTYTYSKETIDGVEGWYFESKKKEQHTGNGTECTKCHGKKKKKKTSSGGSSSSSSSSSRSNTTRQTAVEIGPGSESYARSQAAEEQAQQASRKREQDTMVAQAEARKRNAATSSSSSNSCSGCSTTCKNSCVQGCAEKVTGPNDKRARGGYVGHGIYELGEQGTETVLTASQTQVLRNNILSNRPNSLISLLKTYNEGFSQAGNPLTGIPSTEDNSTNIDKVEINMNVQQISNDYDARRAGEQAMEEIMRIARKTSAANSIRR